MEERKPLGWCVTVALWIVSLVPVVAGLVRVAKVATGASHAADEIRFVLSPAPVVIHAVASTIYCVVGALQFNAVFRQRHLALHRRLGKVALIAGVLSALSGLWMTVGYGIPEALQGPLLQGVRLLVGLGMTETLWLAWRTVKERDWRGHFAWSVRAYALGQGAGTQVLVILPITLLHGPVTGTWRDVLMTLAWVINLAVAEVIVRRANTPAGGDK